MTNIEEMFRGEEKALLAEEIFRGEESEGFKIIKDIFEIRQNAF